MNLTSIEWVLNPDGTQGYTLNPITGCLNHVNGLCRDGNFPCYAFKLAHGRLKERYRANTNTIPSLVINDTAINMMQKQVKAEVDPFYPRFWPDKFKELKKRNDDIYLRHSTTRRSLKRRGIFICDMSDLFGIGIPESLTQRIMDEIWVNEGHDRFYLLTKQHQNLVNFSPFPKGCWVGVTATNAQMLAGALGTLSEIEAEVKYISLEPFLDWEPEESLQTWVSWMRMAGISWIIIGPQTKPTIAPPLNGVPEVIHIAKMAGAKVFLKNEMKCVMGVGAVMQEMPDTK